jgi:cytochrome c oxidase subunit 2
LYGLEHDQRRRGAETHYGGLQIAVLVVFASLAGVIALVFVVAAAMSQESVPYVQVQRAGYWLRKRWLAALVALVPPALALGILAAPGTGGTGSRVEVEVVGRQFSFSVDPDSVPVGTRVRFSVTSADVNHGMGVVDPSGELVGSVQMMPGYTNRLDMTLTKPGRYRFLCFEYCGLAHHAMEGGLTVTPR